MTEKCDLINEYDFVIPGTSSLRIRIYQNLQRKLLSNNRKSCVLRFKKLNLIKIAIENFNSYIGSLPWTRYCLQFSLPLTYLSFSSHVNSL